MKPSPVSSADMNEASATKTSAPSANGGQSFDMALEAAGLEQPGSQSGSQPALGPPGAPQYIPPALLTPEPLKAPSPSGVTAAAAYRKAVEQQATPAQMSGLQMYKDDQLLRNPGGRNYYLDEKKVVENSNKQPVGALISKDFSAVVGNIKNFFGNMFLGTTVLHRNERNEITQGSQRGLLRTIGDFCKDLGSALSLGAWHPDSAVAPHGLKNRFLYSVSKLKDAFFGDILTGVPSSVNHMGKNLILSGLHLAEVLPDALTGGFEPGQKVTTAIFDNGHVALEYLTDIIPSGDAWLRVHASNWKELKPPVLYNLKMPEYCKGDVRWENVRNTPFRKSIETIGALITDALAIGFAGQTGISSNRRNQIE
ncbi:conserved hypothetical protein [Syntrophobacter sp. SbD1]|nr:conserved hypothetical protein [Syntrophobacter sp. SbD1]